MSRKAGWLALVVVFCLPLNAGLIDDEWARARGDANSNGYVDATDGVFINNWLFNGGDEPPCLNQADVNGNGDVDLTDTTYLFNWLFLGGPPPASPGPYNTKCRQVGNPISCEQISCN